MILPVVHCLCYRQICSVLGLTTLIPTLPYNNSCASNNGRACLRAGAGSPETGKVKPCGLAPHPWHPLAALRPWLYLRWCRVWASPAAGGGDNFKRIVGICTCQRGQWVLGGRADGQDLEAPHVTDSSRLEVRTTFCHIKLYILWDVGTCAHAWFCESYSYARLQPTGS